MNKFVIGIGSQRAGSTLLHKILDECTKIFMHPVKELHYFDTLYNVRGQDVLTKYSKIQFEREFERLISSNDHSYIRNKRYKCYLRTNKLLYEKKIKEISYLDLYRPCLMDNEIIGEITPEYMILPEEGVLAMAETVGEATPIILISRDPIERFISAFKLLKSYGNDNVDMSNFEIDIVNVFKNMPSWIEQQKKLSNYQNAFELYSKYFSKVLMISYDELVNSPISTHEKLESHLNIDVNLENYQKILKNKINSIGETAFISKKTRALLAEMLEYNL